MPESFASRFAKVRAEYGPLVWGLDPSGALLEDWKLGDNPDGLERFVDIVLEAAVGTVGLVKPQSAFYERHGWRGIKALHRLLEDARGGGLLTILDVKRGDVGSTNAAYSEAFLGNDAELQADAITVHPYLGLGAMDAFVSRAAHTGSCLLVVTRSSNPEGREIQAAVTPDGRSVEADLLERIAALNERLAPGEIGPIGAVVGPTRLDPRSTSFARTASSSLLVSELMARRRAMCRRSLRPARTGSCRALRAHCSLTQTSDVSETAPRRSQRSSRGCSEREL